METLRTRSRWSAILLGALVLGATAFAGAAGAVYPKQYGGIPGAANHYDTHSAVIKGTKAQDAAPLLDTFDRATAMREHKAIKPVDETPLLDTFDRATALKPTGIPKPAKNTRD